MKPNGKLVVVQFVASPVAGFLPQCDEARGGVAL